MPLPLPLSLPLAVPVTCPAPPVGLSAALPLPPPHWLALGQPEALPSKEALADTEGLVSWPREGLAVPVGVGVGLGTGVGVEGGTAPEALPLPPLPP